MAFGVRLLPGRRLRRCSFDLVRQVGSGARGRPRGAGHARDAARGDRPARSAQHFHWGHLLADVGVAVSFIFL